MCGIAFANGILNIHNQEIAESIVFALGWIGQDLGPWLNVDGELPIMPNPFRAKAGGGSDEHPAMP